MFLVETEHFDCSTATVHFVTTNISTLEGSKYEKVINVSILAIYNGNKFFKV